jgi:hypothetical protein
MYALVELFGHQRIAGKVSEAEFGGGELIRIDVPGDGDNRSPLTKYYNVKAVYGLTPVDEETCMRMAAEINTATIDAWSLKNEFARMQTRLGGGQATDDNDMPF